MNREQLTQQRRAAYDQVRRLRDTFYANGRQWNPGEKEAWDKANDEYFSIVKEIEKTEGSSTASSGTMTIARRTKQNNALPYLKARQKSLRESIQQQGAKFKANGDRWLGSEQEVWNGLNAEYDLIDAKIKAEEAAISADVHEVDRYFNEPVDTKIGNSTLGYPDASGFLPTAGATGGGKGSLFRDAATGREIRALTASESLAARCREELDGAERGDEIRPGAVLLASAINDRSILNSAERAAIATGIDGQGGDFLPTVIGSRVYDLARSASVCIRAGAQTLPLEGGRTRLIQVASDPATFWRREMQHTPTSTMTFSTIELEPKMLACLVPLSLEMIEDAANAVSVVQSTMGAAMGLALDKAMLFGSGSEGEPRGIINTAGISGVMTSGDPTDYSLPSAAIEAILTANYPGEINSLGWIQHPSMAAIYDSLVDGELRPLQPTPWAAQLRRMYTTSLTPEAVPGETEVTDIVGDFSQVILGMRTRGVRFEQFRAGTVQDQSGAETNLLSQFAAVIRVYMRVDVAVVRPAWLAKIYRTELGS